MPVYSSMAILIICYIIWVMHWWLHLTPSPMNNTHKYSIINLLFYRVHNTSYIKVKSDVPMHNYVSTKPWRHTRMGEWRYRSTILHLGIRWRWVSFTLLPLYSRRKSPSTHCIGCWVGPKVGMDTVRNRTLAVQPVVISTELSQLLE
jgi:hypothetical protein